ncbi:hypothetical protein L2E82_00490 [Cichorium intybus]|uniref:Uncharacterized protein n=1 Tax=Cichorium intybus TaxID=13427 RepID=A0ACB9GY43_CICIN|nr:hypothetical protein L2E82_00490 [Cichorium intybus]
MDEFGMLAKDFGFRPQGKSAPMKSSAGDRRSRQSPSSATFTADGNDIFNEVFGSTPKHTNNNSKSTSSMSDFDYDSIFKDSPSANNNEAKTKPTSSNSPVYDKPIYDDDIFDGLPGIKSKPVSTSSPGRYDDNIFASMTSSPPKPTQQSDHLDDLFGNFRRAEKVEPNRHQSDKSPRGLDDLIPGFGGGSPASSSRWNSDPSPKSASKTKEKSNSVDDPFAVLESISTPSASSQSLFTDPLEEISKIGKSRSAKAGASGDMFSDIGPFNNKSSPNNRGKGQTQTPSEEGSSIGSAQSSVSRDHPIEESPSQKTPFEEHQTIFDIPTVSRSSPTSHTETSSQAGTSPISEENLNLQHNDIWLTVSEIPLFTPVTTAPPPSRPPPPIPRKSSQLDDLESLSIGNKTPNKHDDKDMDRVVEKEKMREMEREKTRQVMERATREARERAAIEARLKSERAAVQRAQAEARERAAVEAKGRAERAAAEAREKAAAEKAASEAKEKEAREKAAVAKAQAEARRRAERAAVERVTAEARQRAATEARDRAAAASAATAAAKANQQKNDNDLDSFFNMGSRPSSVPKSRTASDSVTDPLSQERRAPEAAHRASSSAGASSNVGKASPTNNFGDDLSSIFGAATPAGEFQDVEGESEDRRRARLERQQRTQERAAKALAEKNERDMQSQKEQEERHRISATLDVEIKRWAAGKEGNLRAMLSTLQYVLWPECGWQPISLTDLITGASVKKAYRKATLCIHPDKVQQKGANLQQKYVAEKVFDLLKEAWNKFNSEELF